MPDKQNTYPKLAPSDLKDPSLFRLQTTIDFLYSQIDKLQNAPSFDSSRSGQTSITGGVSGQVLTSNGAAKATFQDLPTSTVLSATPSGALTNGVAFADVPGLDVTLALDGDWVITVTLDIGCDNTSGGASGQLVVNGVVQTGFLRYTSSAASTGIAITRSWVYTNAGSNLAKIQGKCGFALGSSVINATNTFLMAEFKG